MTPRKFALTVLLMLASCVVLAEAPVVRVLGPDAVVADLRTQLQRRLPAVDFLREDIAIAASTAQPASAATRAQPRLVIAVGAAAFLDAVEAQRRNNDNVPVIGVALSRQAYRQAPPGRHTALFWEPDPVQQLRLARVLLPGALRAGIVLGTADDALLAALRKEAARLQLTLVVEVLGKNETRSDALSRRLNSVLADSDFLLGVDDPLVFSAAHAKTVLLTSYRHGKPVIGPTASWVTAGSVASLASGMPALLDALAKTLPAMLVDGELPAPRYHEFDSISTNASVARSLQLSLPALPRIEAQLRGEGENHE